MTALAGRADLAQSIRAGLQRFAGIWANLSSSVAGERLRSLRRVVEKLGVAGADRAAQRAVLDNAFLADGAITGIGAFRLTPGDVTAEIAGSRDPDLMILGAVHNGVAAPNALFVTVASPASNDSAMLVHPVRPFSGNVSGKHLLRVTS